MCYISGIFTVPMSGAWKVTFGLKSVTKSGEWNSVFLYLNGQPLQESLHHTYNSDSGTVTSTSGRGVTREANAGDTIELRTSVDGAYAYINFCAEYIAKL